MVGICLSSMHPTTLEILMEIRIIGLLPEVTERCYQGNVIRLDSFKPIFTQLTYSPVILLFDGFVPGKKVIRKSVRGMHTFLKICIQQTYIVLWISEVLK